MKYTLAAIAMAIASPAVFAQSSVTLYGLIDVSGQYIKSGTTTLRELTNGGLAGSRIGFKGTEDLGGGTFVDFVLEGGLNIDTGTSAQGGALFGRQAFGALRNANFGTLSAGRQYSSLYIQSGEFSAFSNVTGTGASTAIIGGYAGGYEPVQGGGTAVAAPAVVAGGPTTTAAVNSTNSESLNGGPARVNNSVRYTTPSFSGFKASALVGLGEVSGNTKNTRLFDGSVRYTGFGFDAYVSYVSDKASGTGYTNTIVSAANGSTSAVNIQTITASASYTIDALKVYAGYLKGDDKRNVAAQYQHDGRGLWLGADYRIGQNLLKAQWVNNEIDNNVAGASDYKTNAYGLGYQFDLTKRTAFYLDATRLVNTGFSGNNTGRFTGSVSGLTTATQHGISEFGVGVRHSF